MDYIIMIHENKIYKIDKEPYETDENTYVRGWFIINHFNKFKDEELISRSIIYLNENKNNMKYVI
jgi:hypothetical protein